MPDTSDSPRLPAPRPVARTLLRLAWGDEAEAVMGDLAESLAARRASGAGSVAVWLRGWREVFSAVGHGVVSRPPPARRGRSSIRPLLALHLAGRGLRRDPGTSLAAAGVLALGLAAATTFFAILHGLTRPLPVPEGERVVRIDVVQPMADGRSVGVTGADLMGWTDTPALGGIGGVRSFSAVLRDPGRTVTLVGAATLTSGVLDLLQVAPIAGRLPDEADRTEWLLVGEDEFERVWGGEVDAGDLVGRTLEIDGRPLPVAAVMPSGFGFPFGQSVWTIEHPSQNPTAQWEAVARLAGAANPDGLREQLQARWTAADDRRPAVDTDGVVRVRGFTEGRGEQGELVLFLGLVLIGVALLVIACANVAGLLVVRATERVRALAVQAALGAGRLQLALQLLAESLLIALLGGVGGLLLATVLSRWVEATMGPENFGYYWIRIAVDGPVVVFAGGLMVGTAVLAGLLPVLRVWRTDLHGVLKAGVGSGRPRGASGRWFVGAQLALSCAALVAAGLTTRSMSAARDFGRELAPAEVALASVRIDSVVEVNGGAALSELRAATRRVEGARVTALAIGAPGYGETTVRLRTDPAADPEAPMDFTLTNAVDPAFFRLFDLDLLQGRALEMADAEGGEGVVVVNQAFAARFWPGGSPLGRRLQIPSLDTTWYRVVGLVETAEMGDQPGMREDRVYVPLGRHDAGAVQLIARAEDGDGAAMTGRLRSALAQAAPDRAIYDVRTLASGHAFMTRAQGTFSTLASAGGGAGLLVAVVGLYAMLAFRVRQRRRELGVRKALGADGATLVREVLTVALRQLLPAVAVGLGLAWLAAPLLGAILMGGEPRSPLVFGGVALLFVGAGLGAAVVPALRAGRVEPASVLRSE